VTAFVACGGVPGTWEAAKESPKESLEKEVATAAWRDPRGLRQGGAALRPPRLCDEIDVHHLTQQSIYLAFTHPHRDQSPAVAGRVLRQVGRPLRRG